MRPVLVNGLTQWRARFGQTRRTDRADAAERGLQKGLSRDLTPKRVHNGIAAEPPRQKTGVRRQRLTLSKSCKETPAPSPNRGQRCVP